MSQFAVVDIFAGPGGLAEGFSRSLDGDGIPAFKIALSIEKDPVAHSTLRLRSFLRRFDVYPEAYYRFLNEGGNEPDWAHLYPSEWKQSESETWQMELGKEDPAIRLDARLDRIRDVNRGNVVLIGGPPCQAYSLVGRARNQGKAGYIASEDGRHFLYREYIRILDRLRPVAFVMENVKGLLSSSVDGTNRIVDRVLSDLGGDRPGAEQYRLVALAPKRGQRVPRTGIHSAEDFVVRAEEFGIPQARHRVIVVGIRADVAGQIPLAAFSGLLQQYRSETRVEDVLGGMPRLRSGLSKVADSPEEWRKVAMQSAVFVAGLETSLPDDLHARFATLAFHYKNRLEQVRRLPPRTGGKAAISDGCPDDLRKWLVDPKLTQLPNHETRTHMVADLARYFFAAVFAEAAGRSPNARGFPTALAPAHRNWSTGKFADRFRVQVRNRPSTTVTCHISKDGHYFIHPDPFQCRSLTVREAARLQTFPDNYLFKGGRTEQYVQVGNAVPPLLARMIGASLFSLLAQRNADRAGIAERQRNGLAHVA